MEFNSTHQTPAQEIPTRMERMEGLGYLQHQSR